MIDYHPRHRTPPRPSRRPLRDVRLAIFGPTFREIAEAANRLAIAIKTAAWMRAVDAYNGPEFHDPTLRRDHTAEGYAALYWRGYMSLRELEALEHFEWLNRLPSV